MVTRGKNKGFTLVELMVSITISVVVIAAIAYFINHSSNNYRHANEEISLQMEAQTILNQLDDLIMEAHNVKFNAVTKTLTIYQSVSTYRIEFNVSSHKLMFEKYLVGDSPTGSTKLFGNYVESFDVIDTGSENKNNNIQISLLLKNGLRSYPIENHVVAIRNHIK